MPIASKAELLILIPTNGRPHCLEDCLLSIQNNTTINCEVIVLDSTDNSTTKSASTEYDNLYAQFPDVCVISTHKNTPPGKARKLLYEYVKQEKKYGKYILYLDDDVYVYQNTIESMKKAIDEKRCDIVSGIWEEKPTSRPTGFVYSVGENINEKYILKIPVNWESIANDDLVFFDDVMPSLFASADIFANVSFDDRYDFYYDIFDFFMECRKHNLLIAVHGGARFFHNPKKYKTTSTRQTQDIDIDKSKFISKWGVTPILVRAKTKFSMKLVLLKIIYKFIKPK